MSRPEDAFVAEERAAKALYEVVGLSDREWADYIHGSPNTRQHWIRMARIIIAAYKGEQA